MTQKTILVGRYHPKKAGRKCIYDSSKLRTLIGQGLNDQVIANEIGCSKQHVAFTRRQMGIFYRIGSGGIIKIDYQKVHALYSQFKTDSEIADKLECSVASVQTWRKKNGLLCRCKNGNYQN
jgi:hypothetical protein